MQKIFWITPKWPFPVTDGARMATTQLIKNISAVGAPNGTKITLCAITSKNEAPTLAEIEVAKNELGVDEIIIVSRKKTKLIFLLLNPFSAVTLYPYSTYGVAKQIIRKLNKGKYHLMVYDGLHAAAWTQKLLTLKNLPPESYRAHNVENEIWFRYAAETKNPIKRFLLKLQGKLIKQFEQTLVARSNFVFPVSTADANKFNTYQHQGVISTLPIGIQVVKEKSSALAAVEVEEESKKTILFVGKLDWAPNRDGLTWILKNVWPEVVKKRNDLRLLVVGSGERKWLEPFYHLKGLMVVGQVESLAPYYQNCVATMVPVFYGSGTRVKAIESCLYGKVCISSEIGVEGMGLIANKTYLAAETAADWIKTLTTLEPESAIQFGRNAHAFAMENFDPKKVAHRFVSLAGLT